MKTMTAWADVSERQLHVCGGTGAAREADLWAATIPVRTPSRVTVHGKVHPADVREGDPVSGRARFSSERHADELPVRVWRVSPLGVELVRSPALQRACAGDRIDLTLDLGLERLRFSALEIASVHEEHGRTLLAARWSDADEARGERERRRLGARWRCQREYLPTGIAPCGVRYADFVHFRIAEISGGGMQLVTSPRNKFLVPGTTLDTTCSFPTLEQVKLRLRVVRARVIDDGGKDALCLGVTWESEGARATATLGQYLLQFGPGASPEQLRAAGFRVRSASRGLDFGYVKSEEEYREVLALRRTAYVHAGKIPASARLEDMGDGYDLQSRIVTARYHGRIVGSVRVSFPRSESTRLNHEDYCELPASLPPRTEIVEMFKACTHPDFRGSDLFYSIVKHGALVAIQSRRRYILMSCTDKLRPIYRRMGLQDLGVSYVHPAMGLLHHLMLGDIAAIVSGRVNPILWNVAGGPELWAFAKRCGVVPGGPWRNARVHLLRAFKPLAFLARLEMRRLRRRREAP